MKPGRELDSLVARALGYKVEWRWCERTPDSRGDNDTGFEESQSWYENDAAIGTLEENIDAGFTCLQPCIVRERKYEVIPLYSTDARFALQEIAERWTYNWSIYRSVGRCGNEFETIDDFEYVVVLTYPGMPMAGVRGCTVAHAICLTELRRQTCLKRSNENGSGI